MVLSACELLSNGIIAVLFLCVDNPFSIYEYLLISIIASRQEDLLRNSEKRNWTIIRPSLTYNFERLQYAIG